MTGFISPYLIHPHVNNQNISKCQTKQRYLFLEYLLVSLPFLWVKTLGIYDIEIVDILEPNSFGTALPGDGSVKYRKFSTKNIVQQCTFTWTLSSKYGYIGICCWIFLKFFTELAYIYLNWQSSRTILSIVIIFNHHRDKINDNSFHKKGSCMNKASIQMLKELLEALSKETLHSSSPLARPSLTPSLQPLLSSPTTFFPSFPLEKYWHFRAFLNQKN